MFQQPLPSASKFKQNFNYGMTVTEEAQSGWFCKVSLIKISEVRHHAQILKVHRKNKKKRNLPSFYSKEHCSERVKANSSHTKQTRLKHHLHGRQESISQNYFLMAALVFSSHHLHSLPPSFFNARHTIAQVLLPNPAKLGHQVSARDNHPLQASNEWKSEQHNTNTGGRIRGL